jgi:hypothetical protein
MFHKKINRGDFDDVNFIPKFKLNLNVFHCEAWLTPQMEIKLAGTMQTNIN